jgi:hypothetical protein
MQGAGKSRSDWNEALLLDIVGPTYATLILEAREVFGYGQKFLDLFPLQIPALPWKRVAESLYKELSTKPVFFCQLNGGCWMHLKDVYFLDNNLTGVSDSMADALLKANIPLCSLPLTIREMFKVFAAKLNFASPLFVLRKIKADINFPKRVSKKEILEILLYLVSNLKETQFRDLSGLNLLPLADGHTGTFGEREYYLVSGVEKDILSNACSSLIDHEAGAVLQPFAHLLSSESVRIKTLNAQNFPRLLRDQFPRVESGSTEVVWEMNTVPLQFIENVYTYIEEKKMEPRVFIELKIPLVPTQQGTLALLDAAPRILKSTPTFPGADVLLPLLWKLGIRSASDLVTNYPKYFSHSFRASTMEGVLTALSSLGTASSLSKLFDEKEIEPMLRHKLRMAIDACVSDFPGTRRQTLVDFIRSLPLFSLFGRPVDELSIIKDSHFLPPDGYETGLFDDTFINLKELNLISYLYIPKMPEYRFLNSFVFPKLDEIDPAVRNSTFISLLERLPQLSQEIVRVLQTTAFVPTSSGKLFKASDLYDPRVHEFHSLFDESTCFPDISFRTEFALNTLKSMGMTSVMRLEVLVESAKALSTIKEEEDRRQRSRALLVYMNLSIDRIFSDIRNPMYRITNFFRAVKEEGEVDISNFKEKIVNIPWLPVLASPPSSILPWPTVKRTLAPPSEVRSYDQLWTSSCCYWILEQPLTVCDTLKSTFGWDTPVPPAVVAQQLLVLGEKLELSQAEGDLENLSRVITSLYALLNDAYASRSSAFEPARLAMLDKKIIWVGECVLFLSSFFLNPLYNDLVFFLLELTLVQPIRDNEKGGDIQLDRTQALPVYPAP